MGKKTKRNLLLWAAVICISIVIILTTGCSSSIPKNETPTATMDGNWSYDKVGSINNTIIYLLHDNESDRDYFYLYNPVNGDVSISPRIKPTEKIQVTNPADITIEPNEVYAEWCQL